MVKRKFLDVAIDALSDGRVVVQGGCLNASLAWIPHADLILEVDAEMYIVLSSTDYGFASLCGLALRNNSFIEDLVARRKAACTDAIQSLLGDYVDIAHARPYKIRTERAKLIAEHADRLPSTVDFTIVGAPNGRLRVKFETDNRKCIAVQASSDILTFIASQTRAFAGASNARKKLRKSDRRQFKYAEVRMNASRKTPYVNYTDADGYVRYHSAQVRKYDVNDPNDEDNAYEEAAEALHAFYVANHNGEHIAAVGAPGEAHGGEPDKASDDGDDDGDMHEGSDSDGNSKAEGGDGHGSASNDHAEVAL